ncbi:unnamed protein product [Gordionus sp. m RMFG-2023]
MKIDETKNGYIFPIMKILRPTELSIKQNFSDNSNPLIRGSFALPKTGRVNGQKPRNLTFKDLYTMTCKELGKGATASVNMCKDKRTGVEYAVKIILKIDDERQAKRIHREIKTFELTKGHPNVCQLIHFFQDNEKYYSVFEKMEGGSLLNQIEKRSVFTEAEASLVTGDIANALEFLHNIGIAHRDLKPENVLCKFEDRIVPVKLTDFDLASDSELNGSPHFPVNTPELTTPVGSAEFMAPEVVRTFRGQLNHYDKRCDMWSLGVIIYIMLCGYPPFYGHCTDSSHHPNTMDSYNPSASPPFQPSSPISPTIPAYCDLNTCTACRDSLFSRIQSCRFDFPAQDWSHISPSAKDLISHLLIENSDKRAKPADVASHPWVKYPAPSTHLLTPTVLKRTNSCGSIEKFAQNAIAVNRMIQQCYAIHKDILDNGPPRLTLPCAQFDGQELSISKKNQRNCSDEDPDDEEEEPTPIGSCIDNAGSHFLDFSDDSNNSKSFCSNNTLTLDDYSPIRHANNKDVFNFSSLNLNGLERGVRHEIVSSDESWNGDAENNLDIEELSFDFESPIEILTAKNPPVKLINRDLQAIKNQKIARSNKHVPKIDSSDLKFGNNHISPPHTHSITKQDVSFTLKNNSMLNLSPHHEVSASNSANNLVKYNLANVDSYKKQNKIAAGKNINFRANSQSTPQRPPVIVNHAGNNTNNNVKFRPKCNMSKRVNNSLKSNQPINGYRCLNAAEFESGLMPRRASVEELEIDRNIASLPNLFGQSFKNYLPKIKMTQEPSIKNQEYLSALNGRTSSLPTAQGPQNKNFVANYATYSKDIFEPVSNNNNNVTFYFGNPSELNYYPPPYNYSINYYNYLNNSMATPCVNNYLPSSSAYCLPSDAPYNANIYNNNQQNYIYDQQDITQGNFYDYDGSNFNTNNCYFNNNDDDLIKFDSARTSQPNNLVWVPPDKYGGAQYF